MGVVGLLNSLDDALSNVEGKSYLEAMNKDENFQKFIKYSKTGATIITTVDGGAQVWVNKGKDLPSLVGVYNDVNSLLETIESGNSNLPGQSSQNQDNKK